MAATAGGAVLAGIIGLGFIELTLTEGAFHKGEFSIQKSESEDVFTRRREDAK